MMKQEGLNMAVSLDPLPGSKSKYFTKYGADTYNVELGQPPECKHEWKRRGSNEVECIKCHAGLFLSPIDELKDKHIYRKGKFVI